MNAYYCGDCNRKIGELPNVIRATCSIIVECPHCDRLNEIQTVDAGVVLVARKDVNP